jgi:hypothetical protein
MHYDFCRQPLTEKIPRDIRRSNANKTEQTIRKQVQAKQKGFLHPGIFLFVLCKCDGRRDALS